MKKSSIHYLRAVLLSGVLGTPLIAGAQLQSAQLTVMQTPAIDSVSYDCNTGDVQMHSPDTNAGSFTYSVISVQPATVAVPPANQTGEFNLTGATDAVLRAQYQDCYVDYPVNFDCEGALPVHFLSFDARLYDQNKGLLEWKVSGEEDVSHYLVEQSANGAMFEPLGSVPFSANGSGGSVNTYRFVDSNLYVGVNYYRIQQIDVNGSATYSPIRTLTYYPGEAISVVLYPNPASNTIYLRCGVAEETSIEMWALDQLSKKVIETQSFALHTGTNNIAIDIGMLPEGTYYMGYRIDSENIVRYLKFVKKGK